MKENDGREDRSFLNGRDHVTGTCQLDLFQYCVCVSLCWPCHFFSARPGPAIHTNRSIIENWNLLQPLVAEISGQLPRFFHSYTFILLTFIVLGTSSRLKHYLSIYRMLLTVRWNGHHDFDPLTTLSFAPSLLELDTNIHIDA